MLQILNILKWLDDTQLYHGDLTLDDALIVDLNTFQLKLTTFNLAILAPTRETAMLIPGFSQALPPPADPW